MLSSDRKRGKWRRRVVWCVVSLLAIWFVGDFGYSCYVGIKMRQWESSIVRDKNGILKDCEAFSVGKGTTAVLCLHGINDSPYAWRKMAPRLAASGFHVRAMRLPGFAEPVKQYGSYSSEDWVNAVKQEVASLRANHDRVILLSHSLGGAVSIRNLLDCPGEVDATIFLAPAVRVADHRSPLLPTRYWHRVANALIFTQIVTSGYSNDSHDPNELDSSHQTRFTPRRVINQTFELIDYNYGRAGEISVPALMVLTREDKVNDWQASEAFYNDLKSPLKKIIFNDRAGHPLPFDYGWEEITDSIVEFLREIEPNNGTK